MACYDEGIIKDCVILGIDVNTLNTCKLRDVILKYRKKAREVHPDKAGEVTDEVRKAKTAEFQELNNAYERILKYVHEATDDDPVDNTDDNERFMRENFAMFRGEVWPATNYH